jgi:hypothetical protein
LRSLAASPSKKSKMAAAITRKAASNGFPLRMEIVAKHPQNRFKQVMKFGMCLIGFTASKLIIQCGGIFLHCSETL